MRKISFLIFFTVCLILVTAPAFGQSFEISKGQIVYVPALHNYIYAVAGSEDWKDWTTRTRLIIRNVDLNYKIKVNSIELYGPDGIKVDHVFLEDPVDLYPLNSMAILLNFFDNITFWAADEGRPGFIVSWRASRPVNAPIIETITVQVYQEVLGGGSYGLPDFQGIQINPARVLRELRW